MTSNTEDVGVNSLLDIIVKARLQIINKVATTAVALLIKLPADLAPTSSVLDTVEEKTEDMPSIPENNN